MRGLVLCYECKYGESNIPDKEYCVPFIIIDGVIWSDYMEVIQSLFAKIVTHFHTSSIKCNSQVVSLKFQWCQCYCIVWFWDRKYLTKHIAPLFDEQELI